MTVRRRPCVRRLLLVGAVMVMAGGCGARLPPSATPGARPAPPSGTCDSHEDLHAVLWMQTAAEYRALATAVYARAVPVLDRALQDPAWTAAVEQTGAYASLPPAVIVDLDETVLDNTAFQGQLVRDRQFYTEAAWADWVRTGQARAVPGAQAFIRAVEERGARVFYVSNRAAGQEESTIANLRALGVETAGDRLLSPGEQGWTTDKSSRRAFVAERHRVLMVVGDDLGDFVGIARLSPAERTALVDRYADRWLERWVLLPNPSYGSWLRALTPGVSADRDVLEKKLTTIGGYR
jgi:5'-nucleotidase (lipoprotein e(P4) family)